MPKSPSTARRVAVITSSRADYSHLYWPLREMESRPDLDVLLIAIGPHLSPEFGTTADAIEGDGFTLSYRVESLLSSDTDIGMAKSIGIATQSLADILGRERPDLVLVIADRYEMLAPASVALALRIPIVHIEGGEASEGAIDHAVRNALTMMSHVHLTPTELARRRVIAMGEESWRVHRVGAPSLDHLIRSELLERAPLEARLGHTLEPGTVVVGYHPVTLEQDTTVGTDELFAALSELDRPLVFCFPNADAGSRRIIERTRAFAASRHSPRQTPVHVHVNLEPIPYWSLLRCVDLHVGNSSSGIMETPSLGLPAVNVGDRQKGRERARNVIDVPAETEAIRAAIARGLDPSFREALTRLENPYGDGRASARIAEVIATVPLGNRLLRKPALAIDEERTD
ncbi:MAG: UDP-N-acetylglucosamine 2-epimerase [Candidatus Eisenbacteria bacterium]